MSWVVSTIDVHEQKNLHDVLERKVAQRTNELQKMNDALERSNYDLQQFASVASHDLQEPLRKIHMFAKMVKEHHLAGQPEPSALLDKVMQSSQRMKSMIANVLNFSKLSADKKQFEQTDLKVLVEDLLDDFELVVREKNANIVIGALPTAFVLPGQMRQVFQNLISNAIKFSRPGVAPEISIQSTPLNTADFDAVESQAGNFVKISISDNGIGIDEGYREKIFQLFHRLHSKDRYEGTGIGLAITKKIIEKHNGRIAVRSNSPSGTIFEFIIPLKPNETSKS